MQRNLNQITTNFHESLNHTFWDVFLGVTDAWCPVCSNLRVGVGPLLLH